MRAQDGAHPVVLVVVRVRATALAEVVDGDGIHDAEACPALDEIVPLDLEPPPHLVIGRGREAPR